MCFSCSFSDMALYKCENIGHKLSMTLLSILKKSHAKLFIFIGAIVFQYSQKEKNDSIATISTVLVQLCSISITSNKKTNSNKAGFPN